MRAAIVLTALSVAFCQVAGYSTNRDTKSYADREWEQIMKGGLGYCSTPGKPCSIGKQSALAVAHAISFPDPKGRTSLCSDNGAILSEVDHTQVDARPMLRGRVGLCSVPSMNCFRMRHALEKIGRAAENLHYAIWAREAEAEAAVQADTSPRSLISRDLERRGDGVGWCSGDHQESCLDRRAAAPDADAVAVPSADLKNGSCTTPGTLCLRQLPPHFQVPDEPKMGRCAVLGMACMKGRKRAEHPTRDVEWCSTGGTKCSVRRSELEARLPSDKRFAFCGIPGSTCTEKREIDDFEELGMSSKEGEKLAKFVRELVNGLQALDPEFDKRECYAEHGPCSEILKARDAFESAKHGGKWDLKTPGSVDNDITGAAHAHLHIGDHKLAHEAEANCYGPEGACSNAERAIGELETAINEAVALL